MELDVNRDKTVTVNLSAKEVEELCYALGVAENEGLFLNREVADILATGFFEGCEALTS